MVQDIKCQYWNFFNRQKQRHLLPFVKENSQFSIASFWGHMHGGFSFNLNSCFQAKFANITRSISADTNLH